MKNRLEQTGFSLMETLLAVGTLAIAMLFIAGTFLAGIHFSALSTERTIAAIAADEAFVKIKLYALGMGDPNLAADKLTPFDSLFSIDPNEYAYPSIADRTVAQQYHWSALCRRIAPDSKLVQLTVFLTRASAGGASYRGGAARPIPMQVKVSTTTANNQLKIDESAKQSWINDGYHIVDDKTGQIYRVLERRTDQPDTIVLEGSWQGGATGSVWVVPPPTAGGRNPCIVVYQKVVRF